MNKKLTRFINAAIVLGIAILLVPGVASAQFIGSDECQVCHEVQYRDWSASGHPYKLMLGEEAKHRPIPLPLGFVWDDISYVIGGYKWKSRYIDENGYIITVAEDEDGNSIDGMNQYNYLTGEWVAYHGGEVMKPYNCGSCHTTNWVANETPEDLSGNQGGLPGMWGKFDAGGIHCEQCHGNSGGDGHFTGHDRIDDSAEACGLCHHRETQPYDGQPNVIPASGGFIKHHEQWNESQASPHKDKKCVDCHNPHKRGEFSIWQDGDSDYYPAAQCGVNCHADKAESHQSHSMADYGVQCKDCHMPYATKSANQLGDFEGDLQTHIWSINTDPDANMFTEDGTYVALDDDGQAAVTLDFACQRCHATAKLDELSRHAMNFHGEDETKSQLHYIGINPGLTGNWWGGPDKNGEGFLLEVAESFGTLTMIFSFYTFDSEGNQVWLIGVGPANTGMTATLDVFIATGRKWGEEANQADFTIPFGTAVFNIPACDVGSFTLTPNATYMAEGFTEIGYDLSRDIMPYKIACPTFINTGRVVVAE